MQIKQRTFTLVYAFDICLPSHLTFALEYMDGLGPSQQTQKFGSAKAFFLGFKMSKQIVATLLHICFCHVPSKTERILSQFEGK